MRIALHLGTLRGKGSAIVGESALRAMAAAGRDHDLLAWVPREWDLPDLGPRVELRPTAPGVAEKFRLENVTIRRALRSWRADALFSMGDTSLPGCRVPHLLMVQQAYLAYRPSAFDFPMSRGFRLRFRLMSAYLRAGLPSVQHVTVQTEHMRQAFASRWSWPLDRITVVPSAVQPAALAVADEPGPPPASAPYLAYVSGGGPHKNHAVLADVMATLAPAHPTLRCKVTVSEAAAPDLASRAASRGVRDRFDFLGHCHAADAMRVLRGAAVAVVPSRFESFGIPYYEALALGVPTVAADRPYAREPLGDVGRYADPDDPAAWAAAIDATLDARDELGHAARARFQAIHRRWSAIGGAYLDLIECVVGGSER